MANEGRIENVFEERRSLTMSDDETPEAEDNGPRTETEDILEGNLIQRADFDEDDMPDSLHHS